MKTTNTPHHPRLQVQNYLEPSFSFDIGQDVLSGMTANKKFIPSKYFYDQRGSELFNMICTLPEYYLTRTELSILKANGFDIMNTMEEGDLVEMGSGANWKVRRLLDSVKDPGKENIRYVPVDVSESALVDASEELIRLYPALKVLGIVADFTRHMHIIPRDLLKLIVFFGSTIGNFDEEESRRLLQNVAHSIQAEDRFLIGFDMLKPRPLLETAYNDHRGVTAEFNKNILNVVNHELNANFDPSLFEHLAFFHEENERVEMHLRANRTHSVDIRDLELSVNFDKGETIHTENCRKFSEERALTMFSEAGLEVERWFTDEKKWFSLVELRRS